MGDTYRSPGSRLGDASAEEDRTLPRAAAYPLLDGRSGTGRATLDDRPAPEPPSGGRHRRKEPRRGLSRLRALGALVLAAGTLGAGCLLWNLWHDTEKPASTEQSSALSTGRPSGAGPSPSEPSPAPSTSAPKPPPPPPTPTYPVHGPRTYTWAEATSPRIGTQGRLLRYAVRLEDGTNLDIEDISEEIRDILADARGWTGQGVASFQQVEKPPYDMLVSLVSPDTTDALCAELNAGDTRGEVNCGVAPHLVVNLKRWIELSPQYPGRTHDYRTLIINHEVGHVLGYGHRTCPGPGLPAPAMMQQFYGLKGCTANPYVYDDNGAFIDGPKVT